MATRQNTEGTLLISLRGCNIYSGRTYMVKNKPDYDAPTGLQQIGATKIPHEDVGDIFGFPYKRFDAAGNGVYDTGFYEDSPCYANMDEMEKKSHLKRAQVILKKYRQSVGNQEAFNHESERGIATLDKAMFDLQLDEVLLSDNPRDLMTIYVALLSGQVAVKGNEDDPQFNSASYSLVDATQVTKDADEQATNAFSIIAKFGAMLSEKRSKQQLIQILNYIGIKTAKEINDQALHAVCMNKLVMDEATMKSFQRWVENAETEKGAFTLEVYQNLIEMEGKDQRLVKQPKKGYYFKGVSIGADLRKASETIVTNKDMQEIKYELLGIEVSAESDKD